MSSLLKLEQKKFPKILQWNDKVTGLVILVIFFAETPMIFADVTAAADAS